MSGGTEGGLCPHLMVFSVCITPSPLQQPSSNAPSKSMSIGVGFTRDFLPEEQGTLVQVRCRAGMISHGTSWYLMHLSTSPPLTHSNAIALPDSCTCSCAHCDCAATYCNDKQQVGQRSSACQHTGHINATQANALVRRSSLPGLLQPDHPATRPATA